MLVCILIHPAIVLERWDALLICIVVTTAASLVSAQFANRVKSRTVGLVTGVVLTVLGAVMLLLNYWPILFGNRACCWNTAILAALILLSV